MMCVCVCVCVFVCLCVCERSSSIVVFRCVCFVASFGFEMFGVCFGVGIVWRMVVRQRLSVVAEADKVWFAMIRGKSNLKPLHV